MKGEFDAFLECGILAHGFLRQWVLSLPIPLRVLLAAQPQRLTPLLQVVHRVLTRFLLGQAGLRAGEACSGAVTPIQRFGSAANLNIHLHCLVLDEVYRRGESGPVFVEAIAPTDEAVHSVLHEIVVRTMLSTPLVLSPVWPAKISPPGLRGFSAQRGGGRLLSGPPGPALTRERVQCNAAGQVEFELKTPWRDGTTHLVMSPLELMRWLAGQAAQAGVRDRHRTLPELRRRTEDHRRDPGTSGDRDNPHAPGG